MEEWSFTDPKLTDYTTLRLFLIYPRRPLRQPWGMGGGEVTDIYINFDMKKVDEANRLVVEYVKIRY